MAYLSGSVPFNANMFGAQVTPVSISSRWQTLTSVLTAATTVTAAALGSPDSLTCSTSTKFYRENGQGTNVRVRVIYDDDATAVGTQLIIRLWGRAKSVNSDNEWQAMKNRAGDIAVSPTFGFAAADPVIATDYRGTTDDGDDVTWDCDGCDEFFVEITQGMALTGGTDAQARLQVKIL